MIVVWRVNTNCNLNCGFCAYARSLPIARSTADSVSILKFGATLAAYRRETGDRVLVSWLGGEPFLWSPLMELSSRLALEFGLDISATTNGTALGSPRLRDKIIRNFRELTISVDGPSRVHDELREWPRGYERLASYVRSLVAERRAAGFGPLIRINTVLMSDNVELFPQLCEEMRDWGVDEVCFNALGGNDRPEFYRQHRLRPQQVSWLEIQLPRLRRSLGLAGVRIAGAPTYLKRLHASATGEPLPVANCNPGEQFLFINEQGIVSPCSFTTSEYGLPLAEVDSAAALLSLPRRFRERRLAAPSRWCKDCPSTQQFGKFAA